MLLVGGAFWVNLFYLDFFKNLNVCQMENDNLIRNLGLLSNRIYEFDCF